MQPSPIAAGDVAIDTCSHGTWFDARELRMFAEALKAAAESRATGRTVAIDPPTSQGFDAKGLKAIGSTIGAFLDLLSLLLRD
jgi:hypothetical protein